MQGDEKNKFYNKFGILNIKFNIKILIYIFSWKFKIKVRNEI